MAKPTSSPTPETAASEAVTPGRSLFSRLKIVGIILGVVILEWLVAYMYLPGAVQPSKAADSEASEDAEHAGDTSHGEANKKGEHKEDKGKGKDKGHGEHGDAAQNFHGDTEEVDLGEFSVTAFQPVSNTTLYISFRMYGTIRHKNSEDFTHRLEENKHRVRDNVIVIIRSAEITDLTDAGLGLIKRRILETTNKTLGKPLLQGVVFSEFSFVEQ
jgi:flagellar FliL protein